MRIQHQALSDLQTIEHGFFTRRGGTSHNTYSSLNCGYGSSDDRQQVKKNRALVARTMNVEEDRLVTAHQVHSSLALVTNGPFTGGKIPEVDALVTNTRGVALAVLTADCGPLLFCDPVAGVIAAAHAGWRGAFEGIVKATVGKMQELGATSANITAILGPTISSANYEVDQAFQNRFADRNKGWNRFFAEGQRVGHVQFDLPAFIISRLEECNIGRAINLDLCTYAEADRFFSYRRSTHRKEPDYGRQISAIALI